MPGLSHRDPCNSYLQIGLLQLALLRATLEAYPATSAGPKYSSAHSNREPLESPYPVLHQMHWLPAEHWIRFKIFTLIFKVLNSLGPAYMQDYLSWYVPQRVFCSANHNQLLVACPQSEPGPFFALAAAWWNSLSIEAQAL